MKTVKILFMISALLFIFTDTGFCKSITSDEPISSNQAKNDFKNYLNKQIAKHNLELSQEQIDNLLTKGYKLIYENLRDGQINNSDSRKIQKDLKFYLKTNYPDKYKPSHSKNEVNYKLARARIRAITKDFAINSLKAKNKAEIRESWNKVKDMVYKKLDKAAYFNDFNELVVDESTIAEIVGKIFETLSPNGTNNQNNPGNPKRKRKELIPAKISPEIAEKIIRKKIRNSGIIKAEYIDNLTTKIMKKINKHLDKKGKVEKAFVHEITNKEIENFKNLKNSVTKERFIDGFKKRFIKAMGETPDTEVN